MVGEDLPSPSLRPILGAEARSASSDAVPAAILLAWPVRRQAIAQSISVGATAASADGAALRPSAIENLKRERDRLIPLVPPPKYRLNSVRGSHHTLPDRPCSTASRISRRLCKLRRIRPRKAGQPISGQALSLEELWTQFRVEKKRDRFRLDAVGEGRRWGS